MIQIFDQHVGFVGKTGSGKTYAAKGYVEHLLDARRNVCIVDPTGAWWGLRSSANGKDAGYPVVVFGGDHADVPITEHSGAALADFVRAGDRPCIIDLSNTMLGERHRFMERFAEELFRVNRNPLHLVLDEADEFAPQSGPPGTERMLGAVDRIVRRGRLKGFRCVLITQRPAVLNKNVLTQINALVCMRLPAPQDRKAVEGWIHGQADDEKGREVLASLPRLERGEGWLWAPEHDVLERRKFPCIKTYDSSATPEHGQAAAPRGWADVDLDAVRQRFDEAIKTAQENDPKALRDRIRQLEKDIQHERDSAPPVEECDRTLRERDALLKTVAALRDAMWKAASAIDLDLASAMTSAENIVRDMNQTNERIKELVLAAKAGTEVPAAPPAASPLTRAAAGPSAPSGSYHLRDLPLCTSNGQQLPRAEKAIMTVLVQRGMISKRTLAITAGYAVNGGGFNNALSALRTKGYVEGSETIAATPGGKKAIGRVPPLPEGVALIEHWKQHCGGKAERAVLEVLAGVAVRSKGLDKAELAERCGYAADGGGFNNALSRLRTLCLIDGRSTIRLATELLEGAFG